jgi:hypothetical protein
MSYALDTTQFMYKSTYNVELYPALTLAASSTNSFIAARYAGDASILATSMRVPFESLMAAVLDSETCQKMLLALHGSRELTHILLQDELPGLSRLSMG